MKFLIVFIVTICITRTIVVNPSDTDHGPIDGSSCNSANCEINECCCNYCINPCTDFGSVYDTDKECGKCTLPSDGGNGNCYCGA